MKSLDDRFYQGLWRSLGILAVLSSLTLIFIGQANDWLRMALYGLVLGVTWTLSRKPQVRLAALSVFAASYLLVLAMVLDPQSMINRLNLGVLGYGSLVAQVSSGLALYFGWPAAAFGLIVGTVFVLPYSSNSAWVFAAFINAAGAALGAVMNGLLLQLQLAKADIERVAMQDELTGLQNRRAMLLTVQRYESLASRQGKVLLVTSWDLNDLKRINDRDGHAAGDQHLRTFARVLRSEARNEDVFFRIGGDEFVGIHLGLNDGTELFERVQARFSGVAIGWALVEANGFERALLEADRLLYAKKSQMKAEEKTQHEPLSMPMESTKSAS
jgi:GGDEF domain-containing protein